MSTKLPAEVLDKLHSILKLAENAGTRGEAEAAWAALGRMLTKHGIELHQVREHARKDDKSIAWDFTRVQIPKMWRTERPSHRWVNAIIVECFNVQIVRVKNQLGITYVMLGEATDCAMAMYAFDFLAETFLRLYNRWKDGMGYAHKRLRRDSYFAGLYTGFIGVWREAQAAQMREQNADAYALVLVDKQNALTRYLHDEFKDLKERKTRDREWDDEASAAGYHEGRRLKINQPLEGVSNG